MNLSDEAGDLPEPEKTIKLMLIEKQTEDEKKKLAESDKEEVNRNEVTVFLSLSGRSNKKRTKKLTETSEINHSGTKNGSSVDDIISSTHQSFSSSLASPGVKKLKKALESDIEDKLLNRFKDQDIGAFFANAGIDMTILEAEIIYKYEEIGVSTLVNIFCTPYMVHET